MVYCSECDIWLDSEQDCFCDNNYDPLIINNRLKSLDELINDRDRNTTFRARQKEKKAERNTKPFYRYFNYK
tara:strand:+ start:219 stop:434 length:216 start_codon:yes stop_codon:yes gene_type:complete